MNTSKNNFFGSTSLACAAVFFAGMAFAAPAKKEVPIAECQPVARMESRNAAPGRGPGPFGDYWWANRFLSRLELAKSYKGECPVL